MFPDLPLLRSRQSGRLSSWDPSGGSRDFWRVPAQASAVLADITGPAQITHIFIKQERGYRECLLKITYDDCAFPSVLAPLGDFFGLGHSLVNSFQSALFSASTPFPYQFDKRCALNAYFTMPFARRAVVELVNQSGQEHQFGFHIDYETLEAFPVGAGYFHTEFRRANPFGGWAPEMIVNTPAVDAANLERQAYENNYVILETHGRGHYLGCSLSVTSFTGTWWGEGDDMIWVDGYKWPPDLHGTGSEDYLGHAGGMQKDAALRNGSAIFEGYTVPNPEMSLWRSESGYQASYVLHLENPVRFEREIKVTIEHGHANHLANEMSSTAYWYAQEPAPAAAVPPAGQRLPVLRENAGRWIHDPRRQCPSEAVAPTEEMRLLQQKGRQG